MIKTNKTELFIGPVRLDSPFLLAPMAGVTDSSFRRVCRREGCALVYAEMISAKGLYYNDKATERLLTIHEEEKPVVFQLFGSEPDIIAFAAEKLAARGNVILDLNMGCPVPKVVRNGDGSALLKNPPLIGQLVKAAVRAAGKPVTAKIRLGWDERTINVLEVAKIIEAAGASALAVHGRTREQYYSGTADWDKLRQVKEAIRIPLIGNGDVFSGEDAIRMLSYTGCDFVMIARGAYGNPWIFRDAKALWQGGTKPPPPDIHAKAAAALWHLQMLCSEKSERIAVKEIRKHIGWYFKGVSHAAELRRKVNTISCASELVCLLKNTIYMNSLV